MAAARHTPHTMEQELLQAVTMGDADLLARCLSRSASAELGGESCLKGVTAEGSSPLHIAASRGHLEVVEKICTRDIALVKARNQQQDTPLICAARAGHVDVAEHLMAAALGEPDGYSVLRARNADGETAMHEAVRNGHAAVLRRLKAKDSELAAVADGNGVSPLYLAVASNRADMVGLLIERSPDGVAPSSSGPDGQTALHAAVYLSTEIGRSLKNWEPALAGKVDNYGRTALHYATLAQKLGSVEFLLTNSSLAYIPDNDGLFPVHIAAIAGNINVFCKFTEICLNYDELLDNKRRNILHCAVKYGRIKVVWHICGDPKFLRIMNARDDEGNTPLHLAVKHGLAMIFFFLVMDTRVNLDTMNNEQLTPLDVAFSKTSSDPSFTNSFMITCLNLFEASFNPCHQARNLTDNSSSYSNVSQNIFKISLLITVACSLAAASTPPGGYIAEGKDAGEPVHRGRTGFVIFVIANIMSFFLSIIAISLFVFAKLTTIRMRYRRFYLILSAAMVSGAALLMLVAFAMEVGLMLDPENSWDESILLWLLSNLSFPICLRVAMQLWTSKHPWQDIFKVVAQVILLIYVVRAFITPLQSIAKSVLPSRQEHCSWPGCMTEYDAKYSYPT